MSDRYRQNFKSSRGGDRSIRLAVRSQQSFVASTTFVLPFSHLKPTSFSMESVSLCRKSSVYFVEQIALEVSGIAAVRKEVLVLEEAHTVAGTLDALGSELRVGLGERLAATGGETVSGRVKKRRVSLCSVRRSWQCEPGEVGRGVRRTPPERRCTRPVWCC